MRRSRPGVSAGHSGNASDIVGAPVRRASVTPFAGTLARAARVRVRAVDTSALLGPQAGAGWVLASGLAYDGPLLDGLLDHARREYGDCDERSLAATMFLKNYLWRLLAPLVAAFLLERRLPDPGAENVALRFDGHGHLTGLAFVEERFAALWSDPDAETSGVLSVSSEAEMFAWFVGRLAEEHVTLLVHALRRRGVRRAERALRRMAADAVAESFAWIGSGMDRGEEARAFAEGIVDGNPSIPGFANYFVLEYEGGVMPTRVRNVCCLYYKINDKPCFTCPRILNEERLRRLKRG